MSNPEWFATDKQGLGQLVEDVASVFAELLQNAWDEDVKNIEVSFSKRQTDGKWVVTVTDDSPEGFADLRDAFTLFKPSKKKGDATKRGRFNLGEKLVLALASEAHIISTKGSIHFLPGGRTTTRHKRPAGTSFSGVFPKLRNSDVDKAIALFQRLIPPAGVSTTVTVSGYEPKSGVNYFLIKSEQPLVVFDATLPTVIENEDGKLTRTQRKTTVEVYSAHGDFVPAIYEMGIPVVDTEDQFVVNVMQKVPLNMQRDNVPPAYLRQLRTLVLNETAAMVTGDDAAATWVGEALADDRVDPIVVSQIITERYGDKVVTRDLTDPEANKIAVAKGYTIIEGGNFNKAQWDNIKRTGIVQPAGQVTPSAKVMLSADGIPPISKDEWTEAHRRIAAYAHRVHLNIVKSRSGVPIGCQVDFMHERTVNRHSAWYSSGHLTINIAVLGKAWLKDVSQEELDALLIHEFGHYYCSDHLNSRYYDALCMLGARLRKYSDEIGRL